jgi:hypothetical protein
MRRTTLFGFVLATLAACAGAQARLVVAPGERIVSFQVDIAVNQDATLAVREELVVHSEGSYFRYGFTRNLPINSESRWDSLHAGEWKQDNGIRVKILELTEDGATVSYEQGSGWGYPQIRIGPRDVPLERGDHRYVIRYTVEEALGLGAVRDTLYWNAIGHDWDLSVDAARLTVRLPAGVPAGDVSGEARVGGRGVSDNAGAPPPLAEPLNDASAGAAYTATGLQRRQSLSVVVTWPAGVVRRSVLGIWSRDAWYLAVPTVLWLYYLVVWIGIGRPPKRGTAIVRYEPPSGVSAAAARYLVTTGSDGRTLAAVIAALAARGCLSVKQQDEKYKLTRLAPNAEVEGKLAPEEMHTLQFLFEDGPVAEINPTSTQQSSLRNSRCVAHIQGDLGKRLDGLYFTRHGGFVALGVLATFVAAFWLALTAHGRDTTGALFLTMWILFCGLILGAIIEMGFIAAWKAVLRGIGRWTLLLPGTAALAVFGAAFAFLLRQLAQGISRAYALTVAALVLVNLVWALLLKRMTPEGRATLDALTGFRQFLQAAEQDRMQRLNAPASEPAADIEYLPFAIALEVREAWGDRLADAFFATTIQR